MEALDGLLCTVEILVKDSRANEVAVGLADQSNVDDLASLRELFN